MSSSLNSINLIGRLGKEPEMRYTPTGQAVASFSLATDRSYTGADGNKVTKTTWFQITAWGKLAEIVNTYLHKGKLIFVEGRVEPVHSWTDADGGIKTSKNIDVTANNVVFLSPASNGEAGEAAAEVPAEAAVEEEIPF
ncbi:MAG: single-stranded DNA-binding protein [Anaerolineaceae bacterium]|jgi:single-strand DNA-binding protein